MGEKTRNKNDNTNKNKWMKEKQKDKQNKTCNLISKDGACGEWIMTSCIGVVRVS